MSTEQIRDENVYMAKLAEQAERYDGWALVLLYILVKKLKMTLFRDG